MTVSNSVEPLANTARMRLRDPPEGERGTPPVPMSARADPAMGPPERTHRPSPHILVWTREIVGDELHGTINHR
jgi:hypothetical protein